MTFTHIPVLFNETMQALAIKPDGIYVDATFGRGGHSRGILQRLGPQGRLYAADRDLQAVEAAASIDDPRFCIVHASFEELSNWTQQAGILGRIDGLLMDLGVSSPQLDDASRGFSFDKDGPLDMRMDQSAKVSAATLIAEESVSELAFIFKAYGEERFALRAAKAVVRAREQQAITTTAQLASIIAAAIPGKPGPKHKATRCFQALRIAVNHELQQLRSALDQSAQLLNAGGRLCVISFHSLEDRCVKHFIRDASAAPPMPAGLPLTAAQLDELNAAHASFRAVGHAVKAQEQELQHNPRARSAVLRTAERLARRA